jgi:RHS repeat-associated protein
MIRHLLVIVFSLLAIALQGNADGHNRYDPVGRFIESVSPLGEEKFAFDPASNLLDRKEIRRDERSGLALETEKTLTSKLLDNLLKDYAGAHYRYDERGNLIEKLKNGERTRYQRNASNQLTSVETADTLIRFRYDPLGRRIAKHSEAIVPRSMNDGSQYHRLETERISRERNLGATFYGWDGDVLAWETASGSSTHYFYEPESFIPLAQGTQAHAIKLHETPNWTSRDYRVEEDPLWTRTLEPTPFDHFGFYHCDHLGTPQEITDEEGNIAWSAQYKAWGEAREIINKTTAKAGFRNPLRFQGQYFDHETGLHYNRFRYYDPEIGRFISKDPIKYAGGLNLHVYVPNPVQWVDPLGLQGGNLRTLPAPPTLLALPAPTGSNPWMPNTLITSVPAPTGGLTVQMAMAPSQTLPGGWATTDHIPDVAYARNKLAVTPEFKQEVSHVQTFSIPEGVQLQHGAVGSQKKSVWRRVFRWRKSGTNTK